MERTSIDNIKRLLPRRFRDYFLLLFPHIAIIVVFIAYIISGARIIQDIESDPEFYDKSPLLPVKENNESNNFLRSIVRKVRSTGIFPENQISNLPIVEELGNLLVNKFNELNINGNITTIGDLKDFLKDDEVSEEQKNKKKSKKEKKKNKKSMKVNDELLLLENGDAFLNQYNDAIKRRAKYAKSRFIKRINDQLTNRKTKYSTEKIGEDLEEYDEFKLSLNLRRSSLENLVKEDNTFEENRNKWNFRTALYYVCTLLSTIGYGDIAPSTAIGRSFSLFYCVIGVPLTLCVLAHTASVISSFLILFENILKTINIFRKKPSNDTNAKDRGDHSHLEKAGKLIDKHILKADEPPVLSTTPSPSILLTTVIGYIIAGALLFAYLEGWSIFDGFYFTIISLSTIGFGDLVPNPATGLISNETISNQSSTDNHYFRVLPFSSNDAISLMASLYIFFGLAYLSLAITVLQDAIDNWLQDVAKRIISIFIKSTRSGGTKEKHQPSPPLPIVNEEEVNDSDNIILTSIPNNLNDHNNKNQCVGNDDVNRFKFDEVLTVDANIDLSPHEKHEDNDIKNVNVDIRENNFEHKQNNRNLLVDEPTSLQEQKTEKKPVSKPVSKPNSQKSTAANSRQSSITGSRISKEPSTSKVKANVSREPSSARSMSKEPKSSETSSVSSIRSRFGKPSETVGEYERPRRRRNW